MSRRPAGAIAVVAVTWVSAVLALCATRPDQVGSPETWSAEDFARIGCWLAALAYAAWLTITLSACSIAIARDHCDGLASALRWAPPLARRAMNAALAGTLAVAPPVPPLTLHAGPDGRLSREHDPPPARPTTPTTATTPTTTPKPPRARAARQSRPPRRERPRQHRVESGDNLWTIARSELARRDGRAPADRDIAPYWFRVIAANRTTLRSGDPNLIFPGEIVILPNP